MARNGDGGRDARDWDEESCRSSILLERELRSRTVFRTAFAPSPNPHPETLAVASGDGTLAAYSLPSCISSSEKLAQIQKKIDQQPVHDFLMPEPLCIIQGHRGPAYDLTFYGDGEESLLLSCGDDGHIRGWRWLEVLTSEALMATQGSHLNPILDLVNPQHEGPWGALSPIPENNAIAVNKQEGSVFAAAGDSCAYCWDMETCKRKMVFRGHSDYLHCVVARKSSNQLEYIYNLRDKLLEILKSRIYYVQIMIITGSEDGTTRVWDCRSGICTRVIHPEGGRKLKEPSWVSCIALDTSENWLVCGTGKGLSVWNLLSYEQIFSIDSRAPLQDLLFDDNQILAVGSEPVLRRFNINGMILSQAQCAPQSTFSVSLHPSGLTIAYLKEKPATQQPTTPTTPSSGSGMRFAAARLLGTANGSRTLGFGGGNGVSKVVSGSSRIGGSFGSVAGSSGSPSTSNYDGKGRERERERERERKEMR